MTIPYEFTNKVILHFLECLSQEMLAPQEYDLKASERFGHLDAVNYYISPIVSTQGLEGGRLTASYMRDKGGSAFAASFYQAVVITINEALANTLYSPQ